MFHRAHQRVQGATDVLFDGALGNPHVPGDLALGQVLDFAQREGFAAFGRHLVDEFERRYLLDLLGRYQGDLSAVRRASGLSRRHLGALVAKHGLTDHVVRGR